jgi:hypothetical protein
MFVCHSDELEPASVPCSDPIRFVTQFYLDKNPRRLKEVRTALRFNLANPNIQSVVLLNEREYSWAEMGLASPNPKLKQIIIGRRALFSDLLQPRHSGYTVAANADIFLDLTVDRVRNTKLHETRSAFALLRFEYKEGMSLRECKLFGPRSDSQDTWIVHSNFPLPQKLIKFELGRRGCDNHIAYVLQMTGYKIFNAPFFLHSYHFHEETGREYFTDGSPVVEGPYLRVVPAVQVSSDYDDVKRQIETFDLIKGNDRLRTYLETRGSAPFVIPRIAGIENVTAHATAMGKALVPLQLEMLKNNTGVALHNVEKEYGDWYWRAFEGCDIYASWEPWSGFAVHLVDSLPYVKDRFPKPQFNAFSFDIFHSVAGGKPWTHGLAGKRLLIVSAFADQIKEREGVRPYPIDLFPGCTFQYLKPPMTQGDEPNRGWSVEFGELCQAVSKMDFDVALCSCGGYGNPICAYIFSLGKSAIYVGGVLQMYFGIYGGRWLKERKDAVNLYMNEHWVRPVSRPAGFQKIENGCYW